MVVRIPYSFMLNRYGFETVSSLYLAVLAGAYELHDVSLVSDATFDLLAKHTRMPDHMNFRPDTGQWVHDIMTPELAGLISECVERFRASEHKDFQHMEVIWVMQDEVKKHLTGGTDERT